LSSKKPPASNDQKKINLISMPWALFNRPSIQLGTLKAYLENNNKQLSVNTSHPYLGVASIVGTDLYHWISQNPWVSEALYTPLVFPEKTKSAEALAMKFAKKADPYIKKSFRFNLITKKLEKHLSDWVSSCDWNQYTFIGFSVCFHQLSASLAAAKIIKQNFPQAIIVFGGSSCAADAGRSLLNAFNCIDYVVEGEGEKGLLTLCEYFSKKQNELPENIFTQQTGKQVSIEQKRHLKNTQLPSLDVLPAPDYADYFSEQQKWFADTPFIPVLPVEFSRGCWWNKCTFCNLNLQWCGYRSKKASQMIHEVQSLTIKHSCLNFTFVDNMLPPKESVEFFTTTREQHSDFNFFAEIRAAKEKIQTKNIFAIYRQGGLSTIQVGIEALSNTLLAKMQKGISVIENIATLREAQENSIVLEGNLIVQFPGSTESEIAETLKNLDYIFPFSPLDIASFFLGHNSPVHNNPEKFGIKTIVNHVNNLKLFPKSVLTKLNLLIQDYKGDRTYQRKIWKPVVKKVVKWQQYHKNRKGDTLSQPLLYYRDGIDFLLVRQELADGKILNHRLKGTSRQIYLFCTKIRTDTELFENFPSIPQKNILSFLAELMKKRLLFFDKNKYLALAIHNKAETYQ